MKKILPILFSFAILVLTAFIFPEVSSAQQLGTTPSPATPNGDWKLDQEVTFIGKTAARANGFLEWTLKNYEWICVAKVNDVCDNTNNPLAEFWSGILRIVLVLIVLFVLAAAFVIIITRGQSVTLMRFIPRFIIVILLIVFSFALIRFLYQFFDVIQGFFLNVSDPKGGPDRVIGPSDLLFIGWPYENFVGLRRIGVQFDESAYISLLLVKITAVTYYVMTGVLLIRKIILWFFVIISPVFPLLIFFRPLRNTAKIWVGEFFRWLLYAPLFAIFLNGLVGVWRSGVPLPFDFSKVGTEVYPTAINILLAGPGQKLGIANSVNLSDTFALYVVALLMLWVVILLPWLLLQIFLDYINNMAFTESPIYQRIASANIPFINRPVGKGPDTPPSVPPQGPATAGLARSLPFMNKRAMQIPVKKVTSADTKREIYSAQRSTISNVSNRSNMTNSSNVSSVKSLNTETNEVVRLANLSVPKMRDIARLESSSITKNQSVTQQKTEITNKLNQISSPASAPAMDREKFTTIKEKLVQMQQKGDPVASSILNASRIGMQIGRTGKMTGEMVIGRLSVTLQHIASPSLALSPKERQKAQEIKQELQSAQKQGNPLATYILDMSEKVSSQNINEQEKTSLVEKVKEKLFTEKEKGNKLAEKVLPAEGETTIAQASLPAVNRVQQVSLDEYEEVKNIWKENYTNMEPPSPLDGKTLTKEEWIRNDVEKIDETINLLSSTDQVQVQKGMEMVSDILPFLLIGGFSKAEVIAYLKAKQAAGKEVSGMVEQKRDEEDTLLENKPKKESDSAEMVMKRELPLENELKDEQNGNSEGENNL